MDDTYGYFDPPPDNWGNKQPGCACRMRPIKERKAYEVGKVIYRTPEAAAKKLAWYWILTKYAPFGKLQDVKTLYGMTCDCQDDPTEYSFPAEICQLHHPKTGYFRRLHKRAVSAILAQWAKERNVSEIL